MSDVTTQQVEAGMRTVLAVGQAIREAGRIPSGHLYAALMGVLTLDTYNRVIGLLKKSGCVREEYHELIWVEPATASR